jgi:quinone-modifying oxidoreductase subunit QmoC
MIGLLITTAIVAGIVDIPHYLLGGEEGVPPSRGGPSAGAALAIKIFGNLSAAAFIIGLLILVVRRLTKPDETGNSSYFDWFFLFFIFGAGITGLLTEIVRMAGAVDGAYILYMIHLMFVLGLFLYLPYSKFAHIGYRVIAIAWGKLAGRDMKLPTKENYVPPAPAAEEEEAKA